MRVAVEQGWRRARRTILAADAVSFLAAVDAVPARGRQRAGLRVHPRPDDDHRRGRGVPVHQAAADACWPGRSSSPRATSWSGVDPDRLGIQRRPAAAGAPAPRPRRPDVPPRHARAPASTPARSRTTSSDAASAGTRSRRSCSSSRSLALAIRGLNLGIEFKGGNVVTVPTSTGTRRSRPATRPQSVGFAQVEVTVLTSESGRSAAGRDRGRSRTSDAETLADALAKEFNVAERQGDGPGDLRRPGAARSPRRRSTGLAVFLILIVLFLSFYFEWRMAIAAVLALLHDLLITVGIYALVGFTVTPATVIGVLTILGYSLYDTVVVFDKVRENTRGPGRLEPDDVQPGGEPRRQPDPGPVDQHLGHRAAAGRRDPLRRHRRSAPARSRTSRWRCSSASPPARTPRSSSPPRWPRRSRSASRRCRRSRSGSPRARRPDVRSAVRPARPRPRAPPPVPPSGDGPDDEDGLDDEALDEVGPAPDVAPRAAGAAQKNGAPRPPAGRPQQRRGTTKRRPSGKKRR